ncbi:MAG: hypothetical protein GY703_24590 [Gammaproteobacteria bacterium]|nr:hypothetical protein [Gammaproteobacteria bacterium]
MSGENQQFIVQLIGPSGLVEVNGKPQQFIEEACSQRELEQRLAEEKLDVDPILGSSLYAGRFLGCWIHIQALENPQGTLELEQPKQKDIDR